MIIFWPDANDISLPQRLKTGNLSYKTFPVSKSDGEENPCKTSTIIKSPIPTISRPRRPPNLSVWGGNDSIEIIDPNGRVNQHH